MNTLKNHGGRSIIIALALLVLIGAWCWSAVYGGEAQSGTARIVNLNTEIKAEENYTFDVTQIIKVNFDAPHHGIYAFVPYKPGESKIVDISAEGPGKVKVTHEFKSNQHYVYIKLGDADRYLEGENTWVLKYKIVGFATAGKEPDFMALAMVAPFWELPIDGAVTTVTMPKDTDWSKLEGFGGPYGSDEALAEDDHFKMTETPRSLTLEAWNLPPRYGASIRTVLPEGYWKNPMSLTRIPMQNLIISIVALALVLLILLLVRRNRRPVEVVEFYPPDDMTPAEIGYLIDGAVDKKDIISLFFYMADKGYVHIGQDDKGWFKITKVKEIDDDEPAYVRKLFRGMFADGDSFNTHSPGSAFGDGFLDAVDNLTYMKNYANTIYDTKIDWLRRLVNLGLIALIVLTAYKLDILSLSVAGLLPIVIAAILGMGISSLSLNLSFKKLSMTVRSLRATRGKLFVAVVAMAMLYGYLTSTVFHQPALGVATGAVIAFAFIVSGNIRRWSKKMMELAGRIIGFRNYIKTAEVDQLKALVEENPSYYYRILPYAYVFGLYDTWAKKFEDIPIVENVGYAGLDLTDILVLDYMMNHITRDTNGYIANTVADNLSAASDSYKGFGGGGGFSGGGFSGGGFGGGGGGAW